MARKANGAAIKALREALGLSQEALGKRANVTPQAISLVERGGGMRPRNLRLVALGLGVPLDAISTRDPEPEEIEEYIARGLPEAAS